RQESARGSGGAQRPPAGPGQSPAGGASAAPYTTLLRTPEVLGLCLLRYLPTFAWGIASLTIPLLIFRLSQNSASTLGAYGTISLLCAGAAQLATGRLTDLRHGEVRPLLAPLTAAIVCAALLTAAAIWTESLPGLIAAGTLWTMAAWALSTTMPPLIRALGGPDGSDRLVGLAHTMWSAGMLSGTLAAGALIDLSPVAPILLALACLTTALFCAIWVNALRLQPAPA
ncbi:MAG TPA: MFS transporter, partial [Chloroflexota bacterium]|nr:MFS transporter [Chloroflexota bacterium]